MPAFRSIGGPVQHEPPKVKGSRFVASAAPVCSEAEALAWLERVRAAHRNATHHCWAYRLGLGGRSFRCADDGEPGGSAGRPILAQIEGHDLSDVVVVVSRWFGGTKLGVGGLIRAYGGAAGQVLDRAEVSIKNEVVEILIRFPFDCTRGVEAVLASRNLRLSDAEYGEVVSAAVRVPDDQCASLIAALIDRSRARVEVLSPPGGGTPPSDR